MARTSILTVKINGDASSALRALDKATAAANKFSVKNSALFGAVAGGASKAVGAAIDYISSLGSQMVEASDSADKFKQTLNFAGVDSKSIEELTKSTQTYADRTVYDLKDIRNATAQLAANGVNNYDKLAIAAGNLNAVAGGTSESYGRLALAMVQVNAAGKLQAQDWNQIRDAVPGAAGKIKQALKDAGAYSGEFADAMKKGQISSEEFNNALLSLGLTDVASQAAESTSTFEGAVGNFEAAVVKAGAAFLDFIKPLATPVIASAADAITDFASHINPDEISRGAQSVADFAKNEWNIVTSTVPAVKAVDDFVRSNLPEFLGNAAKSAQDFVNSLGVNDMKDVASAASDFTRNLVEIMNYVMPFAITIGIATGSIQAMYAVMAAGGILSWISSLNIVTGAQTAWTTAINLARDAQAMFNLVLEANPIGVIIMAIAALTAGLIWFFTQTDAGRAIWQNFMNWLQSAWQSTSSFFSGLWSGIVSTFNNAGNAVRNAWNSVMDFFRSIPGAIGGFFSGVGNAITAPFRAAFNGIKSLWNSTVGGKGFDVPGWIPGIGGKSFKIPMLATGGTITSGGWTLVGERGPEFLNLPGGAKVVPLNRANYDIPTDGKKGNTYIFNISGAVDPDSTARQIKKLLVDYDKPRS